MGRYDAARLTSPARAENVVHCAHLCEELAAEIEASFLPNAARGYAVAKITEAFFWLSISALEPG